MKPADEGPRPRVVLICHEEDRIDSEGLASWLAASLSLVGIVALRETRSTMVRRIRNQVRRNGLIRFLDVLAFRVYYSVRLARADAAWVTQQVARLRHQYPADLDRVPRLVASNPNVAEVKRFIERLQPELMIARCKFILRPEIFEIPTTGTFVMHPGICPEYRNAHGCFWALARRDLGRVGMTLLQVDKGVDTGPVFLHATYDFDELAESHRVIQYRVVLENLETIRQTLIAIWKKEARRVSIEGRASGVWGQPWLSAYVRWKQAARRRTQ